MLLQRLPAEVLDNILDHSTLTSILALASTSHGFRTFSSLYLESIITRSFIDGRSHLRVRLGSAILRLPSPQLIQGEYIISTIADVDPVFMRGITLVVEIKGFRLQFESQLPFLNLAAHTNSLRDFNALVQVADNAEFPNIFRRRIYLKMMFAEMGRNSVLEEVSFGFSEIVNI